MTEDVAEECARAIRPTADDKRLFDALADLRSLRELQEVPGTYE